MGGISLAPPAAAIRGMGPVPADSGAVRLAPVGSSGGGGCPAQRRARSFPEALRSRDGGARFGESPQGLGEQEGAMPASAAATCPLPTPMPSLEELWPALVRRVACSGDSREGCVFLELGAGPLCGTTVVVRYEGGQVSVGLSSGSGDDLQVWGERIARRLVSRGLAVSGVNQV